MYVHVACVFAAIQHLMSSEAVNLMQSSVDGLSDAIISSLAFHSLVREVVKKRIASYDLICVYWYQSRCHKSRTISNPAGFLRYSLCSRLLEISKNAY